MKHHSTTKQRYKRLKGKNNQRVNVTKRRKKKLKNNNKIQALKITYETKCLCITRRKKKKKNKDTHKKNASMLL